MATITIELPESLTREIQDHDISQEQLEKIVIHLVQAYLRERTKTLSNNEEPSNDREPNWTDAAAFAKRLIADNRALFEELARL